MRFNLEHLKAHLDGTQEHALKLDNHLSEFASDPGVFRSERAKLTAQRSEEENMVYCPECLGSGTRAWSDYVACLSGPGLTGDYNPSSSMDKTRQKMRPGFGMPGSSSYGYGGGSGWGSGANYPDDSGATIKTGSRSEGDEGPCMECRGTGAITNERAAELANEPLYWLREDQSDIPEDERADLSTSGRQKMAKAGTARPDGSFPIPNVTYLKKAIRAFGRAGNKPAVKAWIKKRAAALGATKLLPDSWRYERTVKLVDNDSGDLFDMLRLKG
jgi:hypothetical protein